MHILITADTVGGVWKATGASGTGHRTFATWRAGCSLPASAEYKETDQSDWLHQLPGLLEYFPN